MKVAARFLVIGPLLHVGDNPVRNIHLIDPDREQTMCGRNPKMAPNSIARRWFKMEDKKKCGKCSLRECPTCRQFTTHFSIGTVLENLR